MEILQTSPPHEILGCQSSINRIGDHRLRLARESNWSTGRLPGVKEGQSRWRSHPGETPNSHPHDVHRSLIILDICQRVRPGDDAGREGPITEKTQAATSLCGRRRAVVEVDGVLFTRSALVRGEGSHDMFREAEDLGAGRTIVAEGTNFDDGKNR